jgi:hypothetical protein
MISYIIFSEDVFDYLKECKMIKNRVIVLAWILVMAMAVACGFSFGEPGLSDEAKLQTAVAATVSAMKPTQAVPATAQPTQVQPTIAPANTQVIPPTQTPLPCNSAYFVSETIPDGTEYDIGESFVKTWRLKNIGTCTWNTNYQIVFVDGDKMSGPSSKTLSQSVAPGEQIDMSVNLKAPNTAGTYKGFWKVKDDQGAYYINNIWVQIKVVGPTGPVTKTITLNPVSAESGSIRSNGTLHLGLLNVGDTASNQSSQVFLSFDISGIPSGATVNEVKLNFSDNDTLGDPFTSLGYLRIYNQDFGTLDAGDYFSGSALGALVRWGSMAEVNTIAAENDVRSSVQSKVGSSRYQIRLQFNDTSTDGGNDDDMVRFGTPKLIIKYTK